MATLREIRKRLHSVQNIKQITKAMEMVAAARLRRAQLKAEQARPYASKLNRILSYLSSTETIHPLFQKRAIKKTGVVIVASDKGLCGSYNSLIFSKADHFLKQRNPETIQLILIGRKAVDHYKKKKFPILETLTDWGEKADFSAIKNLANQLISWFIIGELDEIQLIYTHYMTILSRSVVVEKFLNIETLEAKEENRNPTHYLFEPSPERIYAALIYRYCLTKIQAVLNESYASELSSRVMSMRAAHKNADEMIEKLTLTRNKARQASITKEMLEIIAGAEGLKQIS